jgi:Glycosyl transferase family 11
VITVAKSGRLGNQMFQYAFAHAAARALGTHFAFDDEELARNFVLQPQRHRLRLAASRMLRTYTRHEIITDDYDDPAEVVASLTDRTDYVGYFHSPVYFDSVQHEIRRLFRVRSEHVEVFTSQHRDLIETGYTCAHVRLTDFATYRNCVTLPPEYYRGALEGAEGPIVFVSDDIDTVRAEFRDIPSARFESHSAIVDFQLIAHADTVVSSNSSFSWWAAWLNARPQKRVIAPRLWLGVNEGRELPRRVIPPCWEQRDALRERG